MAHSTLIWFRLTPNDPQLLEQTFLSLYKESRTQMGLALWGKHDKNSFWICSSAKSREEVMKMFSKTHGALETHNIPRPEEIVFIGGDKHALAFSG